MEDALTLKERVVAQVPSARSAAMAAASFPALVFLCNDIHVSTIASLARPWHGSLPLVFPLRPFPICHSRKQYTQEASTRSSLPPRFYQCVRTSHRKL